MLPPGNRRRAFYWEKYRRSAGDSCIANEPPENAQWNTPIMFPNFVNITGLPNAEIWRHIDFEGWRLWRLNTTSGFLLVGAAVLRMSKSTDWRGWNIWGSAPRWSLCMLLGWSTPRLWARDDGIMTSQSPGTKHYVSHAWRITGGSRHALTPQYLDQTDSADRRRYSCDVIKTLRATEATCSATSKAIAAAIIRGHARVGRLHATRHLTKLTETLLMYFLLFYFVYYVISAYSTCKSSDDLFSRVICW